MTKLSSAFSSDFSASTVSGSSDSSELIESVCGLTRRVKETLDKINSRERINPIDKHLPPPWTVEEETDSQDLVDAIAFILDGKDEAYVDTIIHLMLYKMGYSTRILERTK